MANIRDAVQQVKQCFSKIEQAKDNPQELQKAITEAKQKLDQLVQQADQQG
jgi:hypothetical protein